MDSLSIRKLHELLYDFYNLAGMKICIYDSAQNELCYYPEKLSPFCEALRRDADMDAKCRECDRLAFAHCKNHRKRFVYTCHAGLTECFAPILYDDDIIGYIALGQIKSTADAPLPRIAHRFPANLLDELQEKYERLPVFDMEKIQSAIHILDACTGYEYLKSLMRAEKNIDARIASFVETHLQGDLSVPTLCAQFHLSRNKIYDICYDRFNTSVSEFVKGRRLGKACELLESTPLPVNKIAEKCGIPDYNYFSKLFRKTFGTSPSEYRKHNRKI